MRLDITPVTSGGGGSFTLTTVQVNISTTLALYSGSFTISGSGLTTGKAVYIQQAVGPYTNKGTLGDEAEMDQLNVTASVTNSTTITAYWTCVPKAGPIRGFIAFNYAVSA